MGGNCESITVNQRRCFRDGGLDELYFRLTSPPGFVSLDGKCCVDYTQIISTGKMLSNLLGLIAGVNTLYRYPAQSCVEHLRSMKCVFFYIDTISRSPGFIRTVFF